MVSLMSFRNAWKGLKAVLSRERNARFHVLMAIFVTISSVLLNVGLAQFALLIGMITLVFFAEVVNTAIERTLDLIVTENNQVVKLVKDMMAGAVMITAAGAVLVGLCVFIPAILTVLAR
ncbi:MAG: diacylglycerol kinase family protein [bacterium]